MDDKGGLKNPFSAGVYGAHNMATPQAGGAVDANAERCNDLTSTRAGAWGGQANVACVLEAATRCTKFDEIKAAVGKRELTDTDDFDHCVIAVNAVTAYSSQIANETGHTLVAMGAPDVLGKMAGFVVKKGLTVQGLRNVGAVALAQFYSGGPLEKLVRSVEIKAALATVDGW
eukprot:TRINITY_DN16193_c0_g3_i1.p1 TRINITY_DN16193_c0_g3~~TRINITY_DN16193_c0_g3_i1.p1  ORF type:complete len:173 (-),score=24.54 TRINITY_DN16193_c0_g3_i1:278-796(-)